MKKSFILLALFALLLTSCSKDVNTDTICGGTISVFVKMQNKTLKSTRSISPPVSNNTALTFNTGYLYFVSSSGQIVKSITISASPTSTTNISLTDIQAGYQVANIPGNASVVYVVGNQTGLLTSGNYSVIEQKKLNVANESSVSNASLYGSSSIALVSGNNYTAAISVSPIISRIEVANITAGGHIQSFQLDGIFINNYISQSQTNGTVSNSDLVNNGSDPTKYIGANSTYPAALPLFDYSSSGIGSTSGLTVWPDNAHQNVWGYDVFPSAYIPHIILRLSNIVTDNGETFSSPQFITITGFKNGNAPITTFEPGKIYHIGAGALAFTEEDLTSQPELSPINVDVTISLVPWSSISVTPEL